MGCTAWTASSALFNALTTIYFAIFCKVRTSYVAGITVVPCQDRCTQRRGGLSPHTAFPQSKAPASVSRRTSQHDLTLRERPWVTCSFWHSPCFPQPQTVLSLVKFFHPGGHGFNVPWPRPCSDQKRSRYSVPQDPTLLWTLIILEILAQSWSPSQTLGTVSKGLCRSHSSLCPQTSRMLTRPLLSQMVFFFFFK